MSSLQSFKKHDVVDTMIIVNGAPPLKDACRRHGLDFHDKKYGD